MVDIALWVGGKIRETKLVARKRVGCALKEVLDPMTDHEGLQVLHYWFDLLVKAAQHLIQAPVSDQFNDASVDAVAEEVYGDSGLEGAGRDVTVLEFKGRFEEIDGGI